MILHAVNKDLAKIFDFSVVVFLGFVICDYYCSHIIQLINGRNEGASLENTLSVFKEVCTVLLPTVSGLVVVSEALCQQTVHVASVACELSGQGHAEVVPGKVELQTPSSCISSFLHLYTGIHTRGKIFSNMN